MKEKDKKKLNVRELVNKYQANCDRIGEIAETCEKEQRERTEAEDKGLVALHAREYLTAAADAVKVIRENASRGQKSEIIFVRDLMMVSDITSGAIIPLNVQEIIKPLTEGFILARVVAFRP